MLEPSIAIVLLFAAATSAAALVAPRLRPYGVTRPMLMLLAGAAAGWTLPTLPRIDPVAETAAIERVTEWLVLVSLAGCGLKIDRAVGLVRWRSTWRMLAVAMPLTIIALALVAHAVVALGAAAALLLAAALAPTDPVLASHVQVGPPGEGDHSEVHFALTSEAGLNDGLAFPFVHLAIALAAAGAVTVGAAGAVGPDLVALLGRWAARDVLWRIVAGTACGVAVGWLYARLIFGRRGASDRADDLDAFAVVALTLSAYGLAEAVHGYGFVAVFVAAVQLRDSERRHEVHRRMHDFASELETLAMSGVLALLGVAIGQGLLAHLTGGQVVVAAALLLVVRPLAGWVALQGLPLSPGRRAAIAFFGIRGLGSIYYLAYAFHGGGFDVETQRQAWAICGLAIAVSVVGHGMLAGPWVGRFKRRGRSMS